MTPDRERRTSAESEQFALRDSISRRRILATGTTVGVVALLNLGGCASITGAFHSSNPEVNHRAANKACEGALEALKLQSGTDEQKKKLVVCFIGVTGGPDASELASASRERLETGDFRLLERNTVRTALKESGVRPNNIFIPAERKKFVEALGEDVDYLVAGYIEKASEDSSDDEGKSKSKRTVYRLELVDVKSNRKSEFLADL